MNYIKIKGYKIHWNKMMASVISIGFLFSTGKIVLMIIYELTGYLKAVMPLVDYSDESKYYYVLNCIHGMKYGQQILAIGLIVDISVFVWLLFLLLKQNSAKKLLIIEHTSLQHMSFSYNKDELEEYSVVKLPINQYETISNKSLPLEEKVILLITEMENLLPQINEYIDKFYQIGYAGIPVGNIPCVFMLGYELDDANKKLYFHKNRNNSSDDDFHLLKDIPIQIKLHMERKENNADKDGKILAIIQLTQPIHNEDLHGVQEENDYILKYEIQGNIDYDIINSAKQTNEYVQQILSDIADVQKNPKISEIKICVAASSGFIFALGTKFSKTQNIDTVIYQFDKVRYSWGINVTKRIPVINN